MEENKKGLALLDYAYSHEQVRQMISIAHAKGWNDARANQIVWSDTSYALLKETILQLFNFKM